MSTKRNRTRIITVVYWTPADESNGAAAPMGRRKMFVTPNFDASRLDRRKRFMRADGTSRIVRILEHDLTAPTADQFAHTNAVLDAFTASIHTPADFMAAVSAILR